MLTLSEKKCSILIVRFAAAKALGQRVAAPAPEPEGALLAPGASFVTWKREGRLRGCIGSVEAFRPLADDLRENAVAALLRDPRFPPATARDFPRYRAEISVLGPHQPVTHASEIEIGRHGLYVVKGSRSGLLLPQVATEWNFTAEAFIEQTCLKAGLPQDAWRKEKDPAALFRFPADVFSEEVLEA